MSEETKEPDLSMWLSTYGLLTAERTLETFRLKLTHDEIITSITNPRSMFHQLLRIPLKNIFNGIILQQAYDYQVYAQKLFVDYLLSGENDKDPESPGANTREDLAAQRTQLIETGVSFNKHELEHQKLIAESQASLIKLAANLRASLQAASKKVSQALSAINIIKSDALVEQAIRSGMIHDNQVDDISSLFWLKVAEVVDAELTNETRAQLVKELTQLLEFRIEVDKTFTVFQEKTDEMTISLRGFRSQFYQTILRTTELMKFLPDYRTDLGREAENRETLNFDAKIGGE